MASFLDSSVLIGAVVQSEQHHERCFALMKKDGLHIQAHALTETFGVLTGGRLRVRVPAALTTKIIKTSILPFVKVVSLPADALLAAFAEAESRGVRGGAIYDYLHLVAARLSGAGSIYTLNMTDFQSFRRPGDPEIVHP